MRKTILWVAAAVAWAVSAAAVAADSFRLIHVDDLASLMANHSPEVWIYDANPPSVRAKDGVVPGARLLSSFSGYDVARELPPAKDSKLVFYCANTH